MMNFWRSFSIILGRARFPKSLLSILLALGLGPAQAAPELGGMVMSKDGENALGQQLLRNWNNTLPLVEDRAIKHYVENLVAQLASYSGLDGYQIHVLVVDNKEVNAFAAPGGIIGINTGLIKFVDNEGQLAGVIAHELAHLQQRHFVRQLSETEQSAQMSTLSMLATIGFLLAGNPALAITAAVGNSALNAQSRLSYSRAYEREADIVSIETLEASGHGTRAIASFLEKLNQVSGQNQDLAFLYTHPLSSERASYLNARAAASGAESAPTSELEFDLELMRLRIDWYNQQAQPASNSDLQLYQNSLNAATCTEKLGASAALAEKYPDNIYVRAQQLEQLSACQPEAAPAAAEDFITLFGTSKLSLELQAQAQQSAGQRQLASQSYAELSDLYPNDLTIASAHARVASQNGEDNAALRAQAEALQLRGLYPQAIRLLEQAQQDIGDEGIEGAKISARIVALQQLAEARERSLLAN